MLVFVEGGKLELVPGEKPSAQRQGPTTNSTQATHPRLCVVMYNRGPDSYLFHTPAKLNRQCGTIITSTN